MPCSTVYLYDQVFNECGEAIRKLLLAPTSGTFEPTIIQADTPNAFPVYETREEYDADTTNTYKGILVWNALKYYASMVDPEDRVDSYYANAGFYVVPSFGDVVIVPNVEYKQLLAITFDSNADIDFDPYGSKITKFISVFINNVNVTLEKYVTSGNNNVSPFWIDEQNRPLYVRVSRISKAQPVPDTTFERRIVMIELRYCHCY